MTHQDPPKVSKDLKNISLRFAGEILQKARKSPTEAAQLYKAWCSLQRCIEEISCPPQSPSIQKPPDWISEEEQDPSSYQPVPQEEEQDVGASRSTLLPEKYQLDLSKKNK